MIQTLLGLPDAVQLIIGLFTISLIFVFGYVIIRENGRPSKTIAWLSIIVLFPVLGFLLYLQFGLNYRKRKMYRLKKSKDLERYHQLLEKEYTEFELGDWFHRPEAQDNMRLAKLLLRGSKSLFTNHNDVRVLHDGHKTYDTLLADIEKAKSFVHIQYYIFEEGEMVEKLFRLFKTKVSEGVKIRLLYDAVGSWSLSKEYKNRLTEIGVEHHEFMPVKFAALGNRVNYRNHRKIVIVDGKVGFTGGINIADKYIHGNHLGSWRDTFIRIEGNAVNGLIFLFLSDWYFASGEDLLERSNFYVTEKMGGCPVQIVGSGPDSDYAGVQQQYSTMINSAKQYVYISNPYFIPGEVLLDAIITTAMSGVEVCLMLPGISDFRLVKWSTNSYIEELLKAGVRIFKYNKGFLHEKMVVCDDQVSSIGTANMDIRSFELNFEVNALVYDEKTAIVIKERFLEDLKQCSEITLEAFKKRPFRQKFFESISRLLSPVL